MTFTLPPAGAATAYQVCARCGRRWPVAGRPGAWCPACRGVLLAPDDLVAPVPRARRNYRWIAAPPGALPGSGRRAPAPTRTTRAEIPRYAEIPRWGLVQRPAAPVAERPSRAEAWARRAPDLLILTIGMFALSALAEAVRYVILLYGRTRLVEPSVLALSDAAVQLFGVVAPVVALVAVIACALRLVRVRRRRFAEQGLADPRSPASIVAGTVVPVVNTVLPAVFVRECAGDDPHVRQALRRWWAAWVAGAVMTVAALWWRTRDSLQAQADSVVVSAATAIVAALTALAALYLVRALDGHDLAGRPREPRRLLAARGPAYSPIAPIVPGGGVEGQDDSTPPVPTADPPAVAP